MKTENIFSKIPDELQKELFEDILSGKDFKLERIVSRGQATEANTWCDQEKHEWVLLLKGRAGILLEGEKDAITLNPGDHIHIPAHCKHRVEWTDKECETVWLALYFSKE